MTYVHECPAHGEFDVRCPAADTTPFWPCPEAECGAASRKLLRVSPVQMMFPAHFRTTLPMTGLKSADGRSGEVENLRSHFNRWDSGAGGMAPSPQEKAAKKEAAKKIVSFGGI